jgi:hypothetical protein
MYTLKDFLSESAKQVQYHDGNLKQYINLINEGSLKIEKIDQQMADVILQMVDVVAPDFSTAEVEKISKLLHNKEISTFAFQLKRDTENCQKRIDQINADPEFIQREILLHPNTGEYALEYQQAKTAYEKADEAFAPYKKYTYEFEDLIKDKYDTAEYEHTGILRFFNGEHLDNWRIGDILCETFGYKTFAPLLENYLAIKAQLDELYEVVKHYNSKIKYIEGLIAEHKELSNKIPALPGLYKKKLAQEIFAFLESTSPQSCKAFFGAYSNLSNLAKTQQGLNAQRKYLEDLQTKMFAEKTEIELKKSKLQRECSIYNSNPYKHQNKKWPAEKFKKRFNRNSEYMNGRFNKYQKTQNTIYGFKNYNAAPSTDILWWDFIMNNKADGGFSKDVKEHYDSNTHDNENFKIEPTDGGDNSSNDNS